MFENERSSLVGVALEALLLFEPTEQALRRRCMGIVARCAFEYTLPQSVAFVELECGEGVVMALDAQPARWAELTERDICFGNVVQQGAGWRCAAMLAMAACTA